MGDGKLWFEEYIWMEIGMNFFALTIGLGNTLELILLLDGIRVGRSLGGVNELLSKALSD